MFQLDVFLLLFMNLVLLPFSLMLLLGFLSISIISLRSEEVLYILIKIGFFDITALITAWTHASKESNTLTVAIIIITAFVHAHEGTRVNIVS